MKKTIFAFAATLILFATTSCKKDKDNVTIQGKWSVKTEQYQGYEDNVLKSNFTYTYTGTPYFEFLSNGTLNYQDEDGNMYAGTYTYNADTKKMSITDDGDTSEFDVTTLTATDLTLHEEDIYTDGGVNYKDVYDTNLKR